LIDSCQNNRQREINSIVFIGNIYRKEKGFRKLIETLIKIDIELKLYIIDKPINNNTIKIYNKLVQLCFVDRLKPKELKYFLSDKHFIVSPSTYDNFNISVMEGIACGLIPMLSKNTGMSELLSTDYVINDFSNASEIKNFIKSHRDICTAKIDLRKYSWQNVLVEYLKHYY
jgi:glycosyltransferase involved in cell wall biosynthesis